jgi:ammonia channel protein AmtB
MVKSLWKGVFNFNAGLERAYAYAYSEQQAKVIMARRIAKKQGVLPVVIMSWMKDHQTMYKIKLEVEWTEE